MPGLPAPPLHYGLLATLSRKQGMKQGKLDLVTQFHTRIPACMGVPVLLALSAIMHVPDASLRLVPLGPTRDVSACVELACVWETAWEVAAPMR